jgi:hypothetical protein
MRRSLGSVLVDVCAGRQSGLKEKLVWHFRLAADVTGSFCIMQMDQHS